MAEKKTEPPAEASAAEEAPKKSKLKLIVFALLGLLVLAGGGGAAAYFFLGIGKPPPPEIADGDADADDSKNSAPDARGAQKPSEKPPAKAAEKPAEKPADKQADKGGGKKGEAVVGGGAGFVPVPSLVVNLRDGNKLRYLRLSVSLELSDANAEGAVKGKMPKITDVFQMFLRTQTPESFASVGALTTVRSEMLMRVNQIDDGIKIKSVLFQELMIQ